jgi:hypothetical protein
VEGLERRGHQASSASNAFASNSSRATRDNNRLALHKQSHLHYATHLWQRRLRDSILGPVKGTKPKWMMEGICVSLGAIFSITVSCWGALAGPSGMTSRPPTLNCSFCRGVLGKEPEGKLSAREYRIDHSSISNLTPCASGSWVPKLIVLVARRI